VVSFAPDGKSIFTGSADATAKLWMLAEGFLEQKNQQFTYKNYKMRG